MDDDFFIKRAIRRINSTPVLSALIHRATQEWPFAIYPDTDIFSSTVLSPSSDRVRPELTINTAALPRTNSIVTLTPKSSASTMTPSTQLQDIIHKPLLPSPHITPKNKTHKKQNLPTVPLMTETLDHAPLPLSKASENYSFIYRNSKESPIHKGSPTEATLVDRLHAGLFETRTEAFLRDNPSYYDEELEIPRQASVESVESSTKYADTTPPESVRDEDVESVSDQTQRDGQGCLIEVEEMEDGEYGFYDFSAFGAATQEDDEEPAGRGEEAENQSEAESEEGDDREDLPLEIEGDGEVPGAVRYAGYSLGVLLFFLIRMTVTFV